MVNVLGRRGAGKGSFMSRLKKVWRALSYVRRGRRDLFWDVLQGRR
jgi:hypothetical protein